MACLNSSGTFSAPSVGDIDRPDNDSDGCAARDLDTFDAIVLLLAHSNSDLEPERDEAYERAAARARSNDFEDTNGKDWT